MVANTKQMDVPQHTSLTTEALSRVFSHTTATYKFYWFIGILDLFVKEGKTRIDVWDIMIEMVANAWYPVCYFHLSFGKSESLYEAIWTIQRARNIPISLSPKELSDWLHANIHDEFVSSTLRFLMNNVPYRFLSPWIRTDNDDEMVARSLTLENGCLYRLVKEDGAMWIELNPVWLPYLKANYRILKDFAYWNLTLFLQKRNPNVPNVPNKLIKPETRNTLGKQHQYWDFVMLHGGEMHCIYTDAGLSPGHYDLDHFMPWSFVSHDLLWNLLPADSSVNSSKSNRLPSLDKYLMKLATAQQQSVRVALANNFSGKVLEDYLSLGCSLQEFANMDEENLYDCFHRTYAPLSQIAQNIGFEPWQS